MRLTPDKSLCKSRQKIIVSRDKGTPREHRAENPKMYYVRHYQLDGGLISQQKCCDFLLVNDSLKKAYLIELKGSNIGDAIPQLEAGLKLFQSELAQYIFYFRIVQSKARTQAIQDTAFRKFKDKYGSRLQYKTNMLKETL